MSNEFHSIFRILGWVWVSSDWLFLANRRAKPKIRRRPKIRDQRTDRKSRSKSRRTVERTDRRTDRRTDERTERRTDRRTRNTRTKQIDDRSPRRSRFYCPRRRFTVRRWLTLGYKDILEDLLT